MSRICIQIIAHPYCDDKHYCWGKRPHIPWIVNLLFSVCHRCICTATEIQKYSKSNIMVKPYSNKSICYIMLWLKLQWQWKKAQTGYCMRGLLCIVLHISHCNQVTCIRRRLNPYIFNLVQQNYMTIAWKNVATSMKTKFFFNLTSNYWYSYTYKLSTSPLVKALLKLTFAACFTV
jgi:hypothetical protein